MIRQISTTNLNNIYTNKTQKAPSFKGTAYLILLKNEGTSTFFEKCCQFCNSFSILKQIKVTSQDVTKPEDLGRFAISVEDKSDEILKIDAGSFAAKNGFGCKFQYNDTY